MDAIRLREQLTEQSLARVADALLALAAPTVRVYVRPAGEADIPIGASKLGGWPDLPEHTAWPAWHEPMAFIGQFNLAALAPYDCESALPRQGLLSFFCETDGEPDYAARWGRPHAVDHPEDTRYSLDARLDDAPCRYDISRVDLAASWRVLYYPGDPATCRRRPFPSGLNERARYSPGVARFAAEVTLPDVDGPEIWSLHLSTAEREALIELDHITNWGERWEEDGHRLLGYPYNLGGPTLVACDEQARGAPSGWEQADPGRRREIERAASARWRVLLQVSSSTVTGMDWAGGGVLHCCIERAALQARDFSRVWVNMQFL